MIFDLTSSLFLKVWIGFQVKGYYKDLL